MSLISFSNSFSYIYKNKIYDVSECQRRSKLVEHNLFDLDQFSMKIKILESRLNEKQYEIDTQY